MAYSTRNQVLNSVKELLTSGAYSDFVITCGDDTYNVHKAIVCSRSSFLAGAVRFTVGREAEGGKIDLPEDEPEIVKLMVQFLYEGEYEPVLSTLTPVSAAAPLQPSAYQDRFCTNDNADQLLLHSKMYEIGEKYDVTGLKDLAREKFSRVCAKSWASDEFPIAAHHVFSSTPDTNKGLRNIVSKTISTRMELIKKPEIEALMTKFNGLAFGILKEKEEQQNWARSDSRNGSRAASKPIYDLHRVGFY